MWAKSTVAAEKGIKICSRQTACHFAANLPAVEKAYSKAQGSKSEGSDTPPAVFQYEVPEKNVLVSGGLYVWEALGTPLPTRTGERRSPTYLKTEGLEIFRFCGFVQTTDQNC